MFLTDGNVRVELTHIGEGYGGEFNADDPTDAKLMRFYIQTYKGGEWVDLDDASYCTLIRLDEGRVAHARYMDTLMEAARDYLDGDAEGRKAWQRLSWLGQEGSVA